MKVFLTKLFLGKTAREEPPVIGAIHKRIKNIQAIWNNEQDDDMGIEKIVRLFLALSQFLFPGTYIKEIFGKKGIAWQDLSVDAFVLLKVIFPLFILLNNLQYNTFCYFIVLWFLLETLLYVPTLIFASDIFTRPRSYRRSMVLLFFNYMEIVFSFAVVYARVNCLNRPFDHWFDAVYFSFMTSATVGYGDFFPVTPAGKFLVSAQSVVFFIFVVLFLNFFSNKVENKGYFDHTNVP